jgi:hypothetical protein
MKKIVIISGAIIVLLMALAIAAPNYFVDTQGYVHTPGFVGSAGKSDDIVSRYSSLTAAVTSIGTTTMTLTIDTTTRLTANTTVPRNITILHKSPGLISCGTYTIHIKSINVGSGNQLFDTSCGAADVTFEPGSIVYLTPQLWGAVPNDAAVDSATAIQSCLDSSASNAIPCLASGTYYSTANLLLSGSTASGGNATKLFGTNYQESQIIFTGTGSGLVSKGTTTRRMHTEVRDISIINTNVANTGDGVDMSGFAYIKVERVWSQGWAGYGFKHTIGTGLGGSAINYYVKNISYANGGGFYFDGVANSLLVDTLVLDCTVAYGIDNTKYAYYLGEYSARVKLVSPTYKYAASDLLSKAIYIEGDSNVVVGSSGEVNQAVSEIEVSTKGTLNSFMGCITQSADRILDYGVDNSWFSNQMPITSRYDHNFEIISFAVDNPATGVTDTTMKLLGSSGATVRYEPWGGSLIGTVISRQSGTITSGGYMRPSVTINGVKANASWYPSLAVSSDPTTSVLASKGTYTFAAGAAIGVTYTSSGGYTGTGAHIVDVWISRDGVKH